MRCFAQIRGSTFTVSKNSTFAFNAFKRLYSTRISHSTRIKWAMMRQLLPHLRPLSWALGRSLCQPIPQLLTKLSQRRLACFLFTLLCLTVGKRIGALVGRPFLPFWRASWFLINLVKDCRLKIRRNCTTFCNTCNSLESSFFSAFLMLFSFLMDWSALTCSRRRAVKFCENLLLLWRSETLHDLSFPRRLTDDTTLKNA